MGFDNGLQIAVLEITMRRPVVRHLNRKRAPMAKLKLTVDELKVTSFDLGEGRDPRGTVQANAISGLHPTCKTCLTNITCCTPML
jgi:hypothetical protein